MLLPTLVDVPILLAHPLRNTVLHIDEPTIPIKRRKLDVLVLLVQKQ